MELSCKRRERFAIVRFPVSWIVWSGWLAAAAGALTAFRVVPNPWPFWYGAVILGLVVTAAIGTRAWRWAVPSIAGVSVLLTLELAVDSADAASARRWGNYETEVVVYRGRTGPDALMTNRQPLGGMPEPNVEADVVARARPCGEVVFRVRVETNAEGFRVVPASRPCQGHRAVLVFGDSYAFGSGLGPGETLPAILSESLATGCVSSYGVGGWGPHQFYAIVSGRANNLVRLPKAVCGLVYYAAVDVWRAMGRRLVFGPRFRPVGDGTEALAYLGSTELSSPNRLANQLWKSSLWSRSLAPVVERREAEELFVSLLGAAAHASRLRWKRDPILVLEAVRGDRRARQVIERCRARGLRVWTLEEVLGGPRDTSGPYAVVGDGHPNGRANARLAQAITDALEAECGGNAGPGRIEP